MYEIPQIKDGEECGYSISTHTSYSLRMINEQRNHSFRLSKIGDIKNSLEVKINFGLNLSYRLTKILEQNGDRNKLLDPRLGPVIQLNKRDAV